MKRKGVSTVNIKVIVGVYLISLFLCTSPVSATQTCRSDLGASTPTSRLINNEDGTATDSVTKLTWKRCSEGLSGKSCESGSPITYTWPEAIKAAAVSTFAGRQDWRLPTIQELDSIIEYKCTMPAVNAEIFPATPISNFWSISPFAGYPNGSWNINFNDGSHESCSRNWNLYVRLVRGGNSSQEVSCK